MPTGLGLALMQLAGACSYLSDCMSLSAHRRLPCALCCWLAWLSRQTSGAAARSKAKLMQVSSHNRSTSGLLLCGICVHHMQGGADDVTGLLTAALTSSIHADRPCQRGRGLHSLPVRYGSPSCCCW